MEQALAASLQDGFNQNPHSSAGTGVAGVSSEDVAITAALLASVETERNNMNAGTYEPLNA